jgi:hypothetical protein
MLRVVLLVVGLAGCKGESRSAPPPSRSTRGGSTSAASRLTELDDRVPAPPRSPARRHDALRAEAALVEARAARGIDRDADLAALVALSPLSRGLGRPAVLAPIRQRLLEEAAPVELRRLAETLCRR